MNERIVLDAEVVIVGAGPVGLTLANLLGVYGVRTIVIERNAGTGSEPRAVTLDDESLRTLQAAGLAEQVVRDIVLGYGVQYFSWRGKPLVSILPTRQEYGYPKRNAFRQPLLERTLREGLRRFAHVTMLFGHELVAHEQRDEVVRCQVNRCEGSLELRSRWLVGCDGARSRVRELCGVRLEGATYAQRWLIVDLAQRTTALRHTQTYCDPRRATIRLPGPHDTLRYEFMLHPGEQEAWALADDNWRSWVAQRCAADGNLPLVRKAVYTFHARMARRWQIGRILLAGDAAHLTPPFAGQGLNSGLRDAANLSWKLAAVSRWRAPASLLECYEQERRPHTAALIRMALRIGHFMQPATRIGAMLMQSALHAVCLLPPLRDYVLQLRFKPKPRITAGFFEAPNGAAARAELLPQPWVELPDRSVRRLDDLLGDGFAVLGWDEPKLRRHGAALAPAGAPVRVLALRRAHDDFLGSASASSEVTCIRDDSAMLDALLDALGARAVLVRPDRYWCRVLAAGSPWPVTPDDRSWTLRHR